MSTLSYDSASSGDAIGRMWHRTRATEVASPGHWERYRNRATADAGQCVPVAAVDPLALSLNESPFPPLRSVRSAIAHAVHSCNRYPEFMPTQLSQAIARHVGVDYRQVLLGAGATGVIQYLLHELADPGDQIAWFTPTFDGYPILAKLAGLNSVMVPLNADGHCDLDALADTAKDARIVAVCWPHSPTGTVEPIGAFERLLRRLSGDTVVIVDEAYVEFVAPQHRLDPVELIDRFPNVVVVRSFSKAYGLAGLRIGYGFGSAALIGLLWDRQVPFGMGAHALAAVTASYRAGAQLRDRVDRITRERRHLRARLTSMGIESADGQANFLYLPPSKNADWLEVFAGSGIRLRPFPDGGVRITVGTRPSTRAILAAVRRGF